MEAARENLLPAALLASDVLLTTFGVSRFINTSPRAPPSSSHGVLSPGASPSPYPNFPFDKDTGHIGLDPPKRPHLTRSSAKTLYPNKVTSTGTRGEDLTSFGGEYNPAHKNGHGGRDLVCANQLLW